jgi:Flp pilus assembly protein TadG
VTRDRGAADVLGLVLIFPALLGLAVLVLWLGRQVDTSAQVQSASDAAAQAAARQRDAQSATVAAESIAAMMLDEVEACVGGAEVTVDTSAWRPGGSVTVSVACTPATSDLRLGAAPQTSRSITGTSTATLDSFRSGPLP